MFSAIFRLEDSKRLPKIFCHIQIFLALPEIEVTTEVIEDITEDTIIADTTTIGKSIFHSFRNERLMPDEITYRNAFKNFLYLSDDTPSSL